MSKVLYLGTDPSRYKDAVEMIHLPLIQTRPILLSQDILEEFQQFTHVILTSPNAVRILVQQVPLHHPSILAIGSGTAAALLEQGLTPQGVAEPQSQEGMIELLRMVPLDNGYLFYPRSTLARPLLANYLQERGIKHRICDLYETTFIQPKQFPSLDEIEEIVFTSPSTVRAFVALYGAVPKDKKRTCIGPVTKAALLEVDR